MTEAHHEEEVLGKAYDARLMRRLLKYLWPYRSQAMISLVLTIVSAPLVLAGAPLTKAAIDLYIAPDPSKPAEGFALFLKETSEASGFGGSPSRGIAFIAIVFLLANIAAFTVQYTQAVVMQAMGQRIMYDLRQEVFARLQKLPVQFYDRNPVGRLMTRLTTDVDALNEMFTAGVIVIFGDLAMIFYIVIWMFQVNWQLALVSFSILPLLAALTIWFRLGARSAFRQVRVKIARINAFLQEHITGMPVVQLFNREEKEMRSFDRINDEHRKANIDTIFFYAVFYPAVEII
ncbi:MAG TPA: ABC transporter ATP-binding protein, partial [Blastocatellia bacterium]|nr:ABC transporter ATP-binding protein [Blastocatellia bacterium]